MNKIRMHWRRCIFVPTLSLLVTALVMIVTLALAAEQDSELMKVLKPAPEDRFAAIQAAHDQNQKRSEANPQYMQAAGIFLERCSSCHGDDGSGEGPWHTEFHPNPANLSLVNDTQTMLRSILLNGIPNTMMPAFPDISNETIDAVLNYVALQPRDLSNEWGRPWKLAEVQGKKLWEPDLNAGRQQYMTSCAGCHGENGTGDGNMAASEYIWPKPVNFHARNSDIGRIYYIISHGREGTFMPPQADNLQESDRWNLAQYIKSLYNANDDATLRQPDKTIPFAYNPFSRADKQAADYGEKRYNLWCAPCHASFARGSYLAPRLIDREWKYADGTDTALWTIVKEGVPGKLMISFKDLPEEERWKILTFIRSRGGLPDPLASTPKPPGQAKEP